MLQTVGREASSASGLSGPEVSALVEQMCRPADYRDRRVLLIVPDGTRTAPVGSVFKVLFAQIGALTRQLDVLIALGTHQPMNEEAICRRLEISEEERRKVYDKVGFFNHAWNNPAALKQI